MQIKSNKVKYNELSKTHFEFLMIMIWKRTPSMYYIQLFIMFHLCEKNIIYATLIFYKQLEIFSPEL